MRFRAWVRQRWIERRLRALVAAARLAPTRFDHPRLIERPPGHRVLMLSPHPDDDAIGAGGALVKHHRAGATITTLVLTDGGAGLPGRPRHEVAARRRLEEQAAARHLGIEQVLFWDEADGALTASRSNGARLRQVLADVRPDCVYLPSFLDPHPDHQVVTGLLARALDGARPSFACAVYESWAPIVPNVLVDVSAEMEVKLRAIEEHRSQVEQVAYGDLARARARWRSGAFSRTVRYAEAFYVDQASAYLALWRRVTAASGHGATDRSP